MAIVKKVLRRKKIKQRIRKSLSGNAEMPRMTVFKSNKEIYAQIIDDVSGKTLAASSSLQKDIVTQKVNKSAKAALVGTSIATKAKEAGVESIVFDRNGYMYHGRIKALAEAARSGGLKF